MMEAISPVSSPTPVIIIAIQRAHTWGTELLQVPYL